MHHQPHSQKELSFCRSFPGLDLVGFTVFRVKSSCRLPAYHDETKTLDSPHGSKLKEEGKLQAAWPLQAATWGCMETSALQLVVASVWGGLPAEQMVVSVRP